MRQSGLLPSEDHARLLQALPRSDLAGNRVEPGHLDRSPAAPDHHEHPRGGSRHPGICHLFLSNHGIALPEGAISNCLSAMARHIREGNQVEAAAGPEMSEEGRPINIYGKGYQCIQKDTPGAETWMNIKHNTRSDS